MSAKLRIPAQHLRPLKELVQLSAPERQALIDTVMGQAPTLSLDTLAEAVAQAAGLDPDEVVLILDLLVSLHSAREGLDLSTQGVVAELRHAMELTDAPELKLSPDSWPAFEADMSALLSPDHSLALTSKAIIVLREHPHVYFAGRVFTDLRPVFGSNVEESPAALVTVHTLKILYHANVGDLSEFFVALDRKDVLELINLMQRALKKEDSLKHLADEKHVAFLEVKS
jgi:hypothetical protein